MRTRPIVLPIFLLILSSVLLAACGTPAGNAAGPDDPAGIRAAVPADAAGQPAPTVAPLVVEEGATAAVAEPVAPGPVGQSAARHQTAPLAAPAGDLSEEEVATLRYMREEEKLARDLYAYFFETWGLPIFENIAAGEAQHMASILPALDAYELADPVAGLAAGQFADAGLQALYDDLVARGTRSAADALLAGGLVEEIDVADLERALVQTANPDLAQLFTNQRLGSANHLRAFASNYERQSGLAYTPQHLEADAYSTLLAQASAGGNGNGPAGGAGQRAGGATLESQAGGQAQQNGNSRGGGGNGNGYRGGRG